MIRDDALVDRGRPSRIQQLVLAGPRCREQRIRVGLGRRQPRDPRHGALDLPRVLGAERVEQRASQRGRRWRCHGRRG